MEQQQQNRHHHKNNFKHSNSTSSINSSSNNNNNNNTKSDKYYFTNKMGQKQHEWSYEGECGPQTWKRSFIKADGKHQSPINIDTSTTVYDENLASRPLIIDYDKNCCSQIKNTGHTFQVDGYPHNSSKVRGGPTNNEFRFLQFHMHWGDSLNRGSEHLVDGHAYSAEIHFVNWNHQKYQSPKQASSSDQNDGLLVFGIFVKIGRFNEEFEKLSKCLHDIHLKDHHVPVDHINMKNLFPSNIKDYWSYPGSLTTPPCSECVQWVVFKEPIEMTEEQLNKCHLLYQVTKERLCNEHTLIKYNDRPVCSMGDRIVVRSFK